MAVSQNRVNLWYFVVTSYFTVSPSVVRLVILVQSPLKATLSEMAAEALLKSLRDVVTILFSMIRYHRNTTRKYFQWPPVSRLATRPVTDNYVAVKYVQCSRSEYCQFPSKERFTCEQALLCTDGSTWPQLWSNWVTAPVVTFWPRAPTGHKELHSSSDSYCSINMILFPKAIYAPCYI